MQFLIERVFTLQDSACLDENFVPNRGISPGNQDSGKDNQMTQADSTETRQLLQRAQTGDRQALQQLFERHLPSLRTSVRRRLSPQLRPRVDSSDVVQETQHVAYRRLDDFLRRRPMPFRLWLPAL